MSDVGRRVWVASAPGDLVTFFEACADTAPPAGTCDPTEEIPSVDALRELDAVIVAQCKIEEPERRLSGQLSGWVVYLTRQWDALYVRWKALPKLADLAETCTDSRIVWCQHPMLAPLPEDRPMRPFPFTTKA